MTGGGNPPEYAAEMHLYVGEPQSTQGGTHYKESELSTAGRRRGRDRRPADRPWI